MPTRKSAAVARVSALSGYLFDDLWQLRNKLATAA
jgi:hypothetical protein